MPGSSTSPSLEKWHALPPLPLRSPLVRNPIVAGADPQVVYHAGSYYLIQAEDDDLVVYQSPTLADLGTGLKVCVHRSPATGPRSRNVWAPELHFLQGKWYIYYAADDGLNEHHRMYVLEGLTDDPLGAYEFKGKIADAAHDTWAIDGTVLETADGKLYFLWSGWDGRHNGQQNIYIAPMANPYSLSGPRVCISSPTEAWERRSGLLPSLVNEGPAVLKKNGRVFVAYSANGFWSDDYCLGLLTLEGADVLNPASWVKHRGPVFAKTDEAFAVGHNGFFTSPDGTEDWIIYHAVDFPGSGGQCRTVRAQPFGWQADGTPAFGRPVSGRDVVAAPSGECGVGV